jgi:hypothetical protein
MAQASLPLAWVLSAIGFFVFWADDSGFPNSLTFLRLSDWWLEYSWVCTTSQDAPIDKKGPVGSGG